MVGRYGTGGRRVKTGAAPNSFHLRPKLFIKRIFCPAISQSIPGFLSFVKCFGKVLRVTRSLLLGKVEGCHEICHKFISSRGQKSTFSIFTLDRGGLRKTLGKFLFCATHIYKKNIGQILILCHTNIYCVGVWEKGLEGLLRRVRAAPPGIMAQKCSGF